MCFSSEPFPNSFYKQGGPKLDITSTGTLHNLLLPQFLRRMSYECVLSRDWLFALWTAGACQAPLSMEFSRQGYWSVQSFPSPRDLPKPGIEPGSPALQADLLLSEPPGKPLYVCWMFHCEFYRQFLISQMLWLFTVSGKPWALYSSGHCSDSWLGCSVSSFGQDPQDYVYLSSSFFPLTNYVHLTTQNHKLFY